MFKSEEQGLYDSELRTRQRFFSCHSCALASRTSPLEHLFLTFLIEKIILIVSENALPCLITIHFLQSTRKIKSNVQEKMCSFASSALLQCVAMHLMRELLAQQKVVPFLFKLHNFCTHRTIPA